MSATLETKLPDAPVAVTQSPVALTQSPPQFVWVPRLMGRRETIAYLGRVPSPGTPGLKIRSQKTWEFNAPVYNAVTFGGG